MAEMLIQSETGVINLLPALPDAWPEGKVKGLCARGGFTVSLKWKDKTPEKVTVYSAAGGSTKLVCGDKVKEISLQAGQSKTLSW